MRTTDFSAWKKELEFWDIMLAKCTIVWGKVQGESTWRRREMGRQALNCASARKLVMKAGHAGVVKLFPRLLSKGEGRTVLISEVAVAKPPLSVVDANVDDV